jgi:hypothetical protein
MVAFSCFLELPELETLEEAHHTFLFHSSEGLLCIFTPVETLARVASLSAYLEGGNYPIYDVKSSSPS